MSKIEWTRLDGTFDVTLYQRSRVRWSQNVWYGRQRDLFAEKQARRRGRQFELLAISELAPRLALANIVDLTALVSNAPFDFVADLAGERVAVDVTTKWQKRVDGKVALAEALKLPLYLIMVSPRDTRFYHFTPVRAGAKSVRVPFSLLRDMAQILEESGHGRRH